VTTLVARLYALTAGLLGAGLLVTCLLLDRQSRAEATRVLEAEGRRELELLEASAPLAAIAEGSVRAVDAWCDRSGAALDRRVTVIDGAGRVLGDSRVSLDSIPLLDNHAERPEVRAALRGGTGEATRRSWTVRRKLFYMAARIGVGPARGDSVAVIRLAIPTAQAFALADRLERQLWIVVPTVFLAVLAGGYVLSRRVDRRLVALRRSAEALGSGDLSARVAVESHGELATLGRVLNAMAERLAGKLAELRAERDTRDTVLANLGQGIALLTSDLSIVHANGRFWTLLGVDPPPGGTPRLAYARQPALEAIAAEAVARGAAVRREVALYVSEKREHEVSIVPIPSRDGPPAWLLTVEDLRPERAAAHLRREFVANASHELKTPLTSIRGYAETLLQGGLEDEGNRRRFVETIRDQAGRLEALVEDLLLLADLERPDATLELKDWDIAEVTRDLVAVLRETAERRGLRIELEASPGLLVRMDRKRVEVALRNLLDNAIKYTDAGSIAVAVTRGPATARVSVTDTGSGIQAEHLPRLFERFYRVEAGRARALGGTGLGLSIVKHAVELHAGRVGVSSTPGEGSTFWIELPLRGPLPPTP
jgi:two-component system phosphate regulon sensor histidine kinase PhoR